jgi:hypothetical protein
MEIRNAYKKAVDKHELPEDLVNRTREAMEDQALGKPPIKSRYGVRKVRPAFVVAVICALMLALTGTAVALLGPDFVKPYVDSVFSDVPDNSYTPVGIFTSGNLKFEVVGIARDNYQIWLRIDIMTMDGMPLLSSGPYLWSGGLFFNSIELSTSTDEVYSFNGLGDNTRYVTQRIDDRSRPDFASLHVYGSGSGWNEGEASLKIVNLMEDILRWEDAGFKYDNFAELCEGVILEDSDNFSKTETAYNTGPYQIPPGPHRISFSDQFPNSYIDNMGFHKIHDDFEFESFFMSIVPGSDQEAEALRTLSMKNLETNAPLGYRKKIFQHDWLTNEEDGQFYDDGRFFIILSSPYQAQDKFSVHDGNMTLNNLSEYTFIRNLRYDSYFVRCEGVWELPITPHNKIGRTFEINRVFSDSAETFRVRGGEVTRFGVYFYCVYVQENPRELGYLPESIDVIMDDGSVKQVKVQATIGGYGENGWDEDHSPIYSFAWYYNFDTLIDPSRAVAIDFLGERIPLE